jgi:hypothetical protein
MEKLISDVILVMSVLLFQKIDHCSETFLFCNSSFSWLCASFMPLGHGVITEARSNGYLHDINICFYQKKTTLGIWIRGVGVGVKCYMRLIYKRGVDS